MSENAKFARRCEEEDLIFIGPTVDNIINFGLKHVAKEIAIANDVPCLLGSPLIYTPDDARAHADLLGYPVMMKCTGGGGGIGL